MEQIVKLVVSAQGADRTAMKKNNQTGSAHVVIIVLLVVALLGALGFVFYQNFIAKPAQVTIETPKPVTDEDPLVTTQLAFNSDIYEIDHPKSWNVVIDKQEGALNNKATITNPGEDMKVTFSVSEGGVGGACDQSDPRKVRYYNVHKDPVTKLGKTQAFVVEAMTDAKGGGYNYAVGLTEDGGDTHAAVGDIYCTVAYVGLASRIIVDSHANKIVQPTVFAKVTFPKITDKDDKLKEMQPLKDALQTDDYMKVVKILESARKK